jgi:hypothetical protein
MNKKLLLSALSMSLLFATTTYNPDKISMDLMKTLGGNLKKHLKANGPVDALKFCALNAYKLTQQIKSKYPADIKRISLKPRNPLDAPNKEEKIVLKTFENLCNCRTKPKEIVIETKKEKKIFKPLFISKKVCLKCHGNINPNSKIGKTIHAYYPKDKATRYKLGDFRGAIEITLKK